MPKKAPLAAKEPPIELYRFGRLPKKKPVSIQWNDVRPAIRLARHHADTLNFQPRIIFDYLLFYVLDGGSTWHFQGKTFEIKKRHLLLMPPFEPHHSVTGDAVCEHLAIHFDWKPQFPSNSARGLGRTAYEIVLPMGRVIPPVQLLPQYDPLPGLLGSLVESWQAGDSLHRLRADALLFEVLAALLERSEARPGEPDSRHAHTDQARIETSVALMKSQLCEPLDVKKLATAAGLSPSRYAHVFRRVTGRSPMEYLSWVRIMRARELLEDFRLSIKEVAVQCGFADPYYFSKVFSRFDGMPPSQYREALFRSTRP